MEEARFSPIKNRRGRWPILALLLCVLAANLAFIRQAFPIDDSIYLLLARNIGRSPWFPQDFLTHFEGLYASDLASTEHPLPVTSYFMALIGRLGHGLSEVHLHFGFLIFPLILACSMYEAMPAFVLLFYRRLERQWETSKVRRLAATNLALGASLTHTARRRPFGTRSR